MKFEVGLASKRSGRKSLYTNRYTHIAVRKPNHGLRNTVNRYRLLLHQTRTVSPAFIHYRNSEVHYLKFGSGPRHVVAFHGFSEDAAGFVSIAPAFEPQYTLHAFDFPFHGHTQWREGRAFTEQDFYKIIAEWMVREEVERFSILAFSMGGRLAMELVLAFPEMVDQVFLIAPDGIKTHPAFNVAVYPVWGRWLFRLVTHKPSLLSFAVRLLYRSRIISRFLYEFTSNHMDTPEKRERIFQTWMSLKHFEPGIKEVKRVLNEHRIPIHLFFGIRDEVIRPEVGQSFVKDLPHATLDILPRGHKLIDPTLIPFLKKYTAPA